MSAQDCAERVRSLAQRIDELRGRASELEEATAGEPSLEVSESRLEEIVSAFREALETVEDARIISVLPEGPVSARSGGPWTKNQTEEETR
jgi:hypothetical protein